VEGQKKRHTERLTGGAFGFCLTKKGVSKPKMGKNKKPFLGKRKNNRGHD